MALEDTITEVVNSLENLSEKFELKNDFGQTIGDELHEMNYYLKDIALSLETIVKNMR